MNRTATTTFQELRRTLALQVRSRRVRFGLTQEKLAEKAGLATRHLQKIEAAEVNVTLQTLASLSTALDSLVPALLHSKLIAQGADVQGEPKREHR